MRDRYEQELHLHTQHAVACIFREAIQPESLSSSFVTFCAGFLAGTDLAAGFGVAALRCIGLSSSELPSSNGLDAGVGFAFARDDEEGITSSSDSSPSLSLSIAPRFFLRGGAFSAALAAGRFAGVGFAAGFVADAGFAFARDDDGITSSSDILASPSLSSSSASLFFLRGGALAAGFFAAGVDFLGVVAVDFCEGGGRFVDPPGPADSFAFTYFSASSLDSNPCCTHLCKAHKLSRRIEYYLDTLTRKLASWIQQ